LGSPGAAPTMAVHKQISETLGYTADRTAKWIETKLAGRQPRNIDAYLLKCLDNHAADTAKPPAGRSSTRPEAAKAGGKQPKKTSGKTAGKITCARCGRDFPSKRSLSSHDGHCATAQCPVCKTTVKARELDDHRRRIHQAAFIRSIQDQPPCIHGVPGGNIPEPNGTSTWWRHCDRCRIDAIRKRHAGQSSTPHPVPAAQKPAAPAKTPSPCERCNRPVTGWAAIQTPPDLHQLQEGPSSMTTERNHAGPGH
jgi:hypothetical protein